jgi:hypothetical protein
MSSRSNKFDIWSCVAIHFCPVTIVIPLSVTEYIISIFFLPFYQRTVNQHRFIPIKHNGLDFQQYFNKTYFFVLLVNNTRGLPPYKLSIKFTKLSGHGDWLCR